MMARMISIGVLLLFVGIVGMMSVMVLWTFVLPLFLAVMTAILFRPLHLWLTKKCHNRPRIAAGLTTTIVVLGVLLPTIALGALALGETTQMFQSLNRAEWSRKLAALQNRLFLGPPPRNVLAALDKMQLDVDLMTDLPYSHEGGAQTARFDELRGEIEREGQAIEKMLALADAQAPAAEPTPTATATPTATPTATATPELSMLPAPAEPTSLLRSTWDQWKSAFQNAQLPPDNPEFVAAWIRAHAALEQFRVELFGGPIAAWFKRKINLEPETLKRQLERLRDGLGPWAVGTTQYLGGLLVQLIMGVAIGLVALYYFLIDGDSLTRAGLDVLPLDRKHAERLLNEFANLTRAIVWSMLLSAAAQGVLAGIGYYFAGVSSLFLLTLLTTMFSMLPFVGSAIIWVPVVAWLGIVDQRVGAAIALAVYFTVVVGLADNVVKPLVLNERSNLHPLMALLSILGGVEALGPIGIFVGPMVLALLHTLLVMLRSELASLDKRPV